MNEFTTMEQVHRAMQIVAEGFVVAASELDVTSDVLAEYVQMALEGIADIARAVEFLTSTP